MYFTPVASEQPPRFDNSSGQPLVTTQRQIVWENSAWRVECNQVRNLETLEDQPEVRITPAVEPYYSAMVVPLAVDGRLLLVERFRYPIGRWSLEFPRFDLESGDGGWKDAAESDLFRLLGVASSKMSLLGAVQIDPALLATTAVILLAEGCQASAHEPHRTDPPESRDFGYRSEELIASTVALRPSEIDEMLRRGEISCGVTLSALAHYRATLR
jgi:hypothetical protein